MEEKTKSILLIASGVLILASALLIGFKTLHR